RSGCCVGPETCCGALPTQCARDAVAVPPSHRRNSRWPQSRKYSRRWKATARWRLQSCSPAHRSRLSRRESSRLPIQSRRGALPDASVPRAIAAGSVRAGPCGARWPSHVPILAWRTTIRNDLVIALDDVPGNGAERVFVNRIIQAFDRRDRRAGVLDRALEGHLQSTGALQRLQERVPRYVVIARLAHYLLNLCPHRRLGLK